MTDNQIIGLCVLYVGITLGTIVLTIWLDSFVKDENIFLRILKWLMFSLLAIIPVSSAIICGISLILGGTI
jgi:hypothetical protein